MGSCARLIVGDGPSGLVAWALDELERLERAWSRFDPTSELCALNSSPDRTFGVTPRLMTALVAAHQAWCETAGRFDPTVLDALETAGYDVTFAALPRSGPLRTSGPSAGLGAVVLDPDALTITRPPGLRIDLGGIGKGLAADVLAEGIVDRGARCACVSLGGDVRAAGSPLDGEPWLVPVEDPFDESVVACLVPLTDGAVVTTTRLLRTWERGGQPQHHIIDPDTGRPAWTGVAAVVVRDRTAARAEVFAKAALVAGPHAALELLESAHLEAWVHLDDRTVVSSSAAGEG
jgi:thiamine biosynthesis lipoprotein